MMDMKPLIKSMIVWDIVPHENVSDVLKSMGLTPPSAEAAELACADSHRRIAQTMHLRADIADMSKIIGEVMIRTMLSNAIDEIDPQLVDHLVTQHGEVIRLGTHAIVAQLLNAGVLTYSPRIT